MMGVRESVAREIKYVTTITLFTVIVYIYSDAETRELIPFYTYHVILAFATPSSPRYLRVNTSPQQ
jgi:hypothetical protein